MMIKVFKSNILIIISFSIVLVSLLPILESGLYSDDLPNFQQRTSISNYNIKVAIDSANSEIKYWEKKGRFTPISFYWMEIIFASFQTVYSYKSLILFMNLLPIVLFLTLLHKVIPSINKAIWLLSFATTIQFRIGYHDAFTSLNAMYQLLSLMIFTSLILLANWIKNGNVVYYVLSLMFFLISILISEIGLTEILLLPFIYYLMGKTFREFYAPLFLFVITGFIYLVFVIYLRFKVDDSISYIGLKSNFEIIGMISVFTKQILAALPLSNLIEKNAILVILFKKFVNLENFICSLIIIASIVFLLKKYKTSYELNYNIKIGPIVFFAITILIIPGLFIVPSLKYQIEIGWGNGYLPVYLQSYGSALLISIGIQSGLNSKIYKIKYIKPLVVFLICTSIVINFIFNRSQIHSKNFTTSKPAVELFNAVKNGALDSCENNSLIILANDYYYKDPKSYSQIFNHLTGKEFNVVDSPYLPKKDSTGYLFVCKPGKIIEIAMYKVNRNGINWNKKIYDKKVINQDNLIKEEIYPFKYLDN